MAQFQLMGVTKIFDGTPVLKSIDLKIEKARTTVLVGPSGCGKSTVLKLLLGLIWPDDGMIHFGELPVGAETVGDLRRRVGYMVQNGGLFPHMTGRQNVAIMARLAGWSADRQTSRLEELAELVRLSPDQLERYPSALSGGQRQRVALMRSLMLDPEVLLMDEPFGALDTLVRHDLQDDLKEIFSTLGKTVVLVTHDMAEAAYFADRVVLMNQGVIVQQGSPEELVHNPKDPFVARFLTARRDLHDVLRGMS